jgi:hypothetical protein
MAAAYTTKYKKVNLITKNVKPSAPPLPTQRANNKMSESIFYSSMLLTQFEQPIKNVTDLPERFNSIISNIFETLIITILLIIYSALPLVQLIIGIINQKSCPIQPLLPIWLCVSGTFGICIAILKVIGNIIIFIKKRKVIDNINTDDQAIKSPICLSIISFLLFLFLLIWFFIGKYLVLTIYNQIDYTNNNSSNYCNKFTYLLAFWSILITDLFIAIFSICGCCILASLITCFLVCMRTFFLLLLLFNI